jgi:hypothetical protein
LPRKFRLVCSWDLQKRLRQFDQIAPWIADNPHITASQFTDRRIDIFFSPSAIVRIRRKSSVPVYQAAAASKSGTRSPTWSPRHEVNGLVGLAGVASLDAGIGFFQKGRKHISQKHGTTCAFSPAITGRLDRPPVERSDAAQTSVEAASQFNKTVVSE